jgi:hypothetical protein
MLYRVPAANGDYAFGSSQLNFVQNTPETVALNVQSSLALTLGSWYYDQTLGMPYWQGVIGTHTQLNADYTIQAYIAGVQGVVSIQDYVSTIDPVTRTYTATCTLNTLYGPTPISISPAVQGDV